MDTRFPLPYRPSALATLLRVAVFTGLAFLVHLLFLFLPLSWLFPSDAKTSTQRPIIQLSRLSRDPRLASARKVLPSLPKPKLPTPRPPDRLRGQVVDLPKTPDQPPPERYRFLSQSNTRTDKETVSRHRRLRYKKPTERPSKASKQPKPSASQARLLASAQVQPSPPQPLQPPTPKTPTPRPSPRPSPKKRGQPPRRQDPATSKDKPLPQDPKAGQRRKRVALTPSPPRPTDDPQRRPGDRRPKLNYPPGEDTPDTPLSPLHPSPASPASPPSPASPNSAVDLRPKITPPGREEGAPAPDHLHDVIPGEKTALNTKQWVYASFFNRVQRLVAQHWDPGSPYRQRDPYGKIYGVKDRLTILSIELRPDGSLAGVSVARSSGLAFLDSEAQRAFQKAQPFPNPPPGLVDPDGKIRFRFGFFLDLSSRVRFRLFR